jgi:AdoMet-dependent heme synthase
VYDRAPLRVYWEITRACDLACRHCRAAAVAERHPAELTPTEGVHLIERLAGFRAPLPHLVLTGGDPLKRADLFDLIDVGVTLGFGVSVSPSATPLLTTDAVRALKAAGVDAISLSLDGSTPERHDAIRGISGTYARTLAAARTAAQVDLMYQVNTLVSAETLDDLPAIYDQARELGAARWSLFFLVSVGRGTVLQQISPQQCERVMRWAADLAARGKPVVTTTEAPHFRRIVRQSRPAQGGGHAAGVRDGNGVMFISHAGDVTPAGFLPVVAGNVRDADPVALYRESPLFAALRRSAGFRGRCGRCEFHWMCGGSRARAYAATGDVLAEDPLCDYEPQARATVESVG